jgi:hypothetical protein
MKRQSWMSIRIWKKAVVVWIILAYTWAHEVGIKPQKSHSIKPAAWAIWKENFLLLYLCGLYTVICPTCLVYPNLHKVMERLALSLRTIMHRMAQSEVRLRGRSSPAGSSRVDSFIVSIFKTVIIIAASFCTFTAGCFLFRPFGQDSLIIWISELIS